MDEKVFVFIPQTIHQWLQKKLYVPSVKMDDEDPTAQSFYIFFMVSTESNMIMPNQYW